MIKPLALLFPFLLKIAVKRNHAGIFDVLREERPNVEIDSDFAEYANYIESIAVLLRDVINNF